MLSKMFRLQIGSLFQGLLVLSLILVLTTLSESTQAGVSRCWHKTYQIDPCEGNTAGGAITISTECQDSCTAEQSWADSLFLPNNLPTYLRPPAAGGITEQHLADHATWFDNLNLTSAHPSSPTSGASANFPDGWYLLFSATPGGTPEFEDTTYPGTYANRDKYPSQVLLTERSNNGETLLNGNSLNGALGNVLDETDVGNFSGEADIASGGSSAISDIQYRNCVRGCGNILNPTFIEAEDYYPPSYYVPFEYDDPPYEAVSGSSVLDQPRYLGSSLTTSPADPSFPLVEYYDICWRECVVETLCEQRCSSSDNPYCLENCENAVEQKYDSGGVQQQPHGPDPNYCNDHCSTSVTEGTYQGCSSYWSPKLTANVKVGAGGCSWINVKKEHKWTVNVEWDSLEADKVNPSKEVTTNGNIFAARYYVGGIDGHGIAAGENPAICVYDMGASWWFQSADAFSSVEGTREGGEEKSTIPEAVDMTLDPGIEDMRAFDSTNDIGAKLCYKLPLPNGPHPCCITIAAGDPQPIVVDLKESSSPTPFPSTGYSVFLQPSIRVEFPGGNHLDLRYDFSSNPYLGSGECSNVTDPRGTSRIFCSDMIGQDICAFEQISSELFLLGCFSRDFGMSEDPGTFNLIPDSSTYDDPGFEFRMRDHGGSYQSILLRKVSATCAALFNYQFCLDDQARIEPVASGPYPVTDRVLCVSGVRDESGGLILSQQGYTDNGGGDDFNGSVSDAVGLCVDIPPAPCGYPSGETDNDDPNNGYAIWPLTELVGGETTKTAYALEDPDYETYRLANPTDNFGTRYCPPGFAESSGRPERECIKQADGSSAWGPVLNPCVPIGCSAETITGTSDNTGSWDTYWEATVPDAVTKTASRAIESITSGAKHNASTYTADADIDRICIDLDYKPADPPSNIIQRGCNHNGQWVHPDATGDDAAMPPSYTALPPKDTLDNYCVKRGCPSIEIGNSLFAGGAPSDPLNPGSGSGLNTGTCKDSSALSNGDIYVYFDRDVIDDVPFGTAPTMVCEGDPTSLSDGIWDTSTHQNDCVRRCTEILTSDNLGSYQSAFPHTKSNHDEGFGLGVQEENCRYGSGQTYLKCTEASGWVHPDTNVPMDPKDGDCGCDNTENRTSPDGSTVYSFSGVVYNGDTASVPCQPTSRLNGLVTLQCQGNDNWASSYTNSCSWKRPEVTEWRVYEDINAGGWSVFCQDGGNPVYCTAITNAQTVVFAGDSTVYDRRGVSSIMIQSHGCCSEAGLQLCTGTNHTGTCQVFSSTGGSTLNVNSTSFQDNTYSIRQCWTSGPHQCALEPGTSY